MDKKQTFGARIKQIRKEQKLSQKNLANGLCSQPMLSAIENGQYLPNSKLLIQLCQRLGIQADLLVLQDHFMISQNKNFSEIAEKLCNQHQYQELQDFLLSSEVLEAIETAEEYSAYYYYLACSYFHLAADLSECLQAFKLALAENSTETTTLARLIQVSLGVVYAKQTQKKLSHDFLAASIKNLTQTPYEENLNILFYLKALAEFEMTEYLAAAATINQGILYITDHSSTFMIANLYYLMALIAEETIQLNQVTEAKKRSDIFAELYKEAVFKEI
ncbi:helix-turn-helix domain-containing protein [Enterococcus sp. AZ103]|uniref:helix-turn-helix domain-containing protein n=1 Tax=Enterococcus sp. AZ103 TaxID=2774628 RepID=UPI003F23B727